MGSRCALLWVLALVLGTVSAGAGVTTTVSLLHQDEQLPRLGLPAVRLLVEAPGPEARAQLERVLQTDLPYLSHVRLVPEGDAADYELKIVLAPRVVRDEGIRQAFTAALVASGGRSAWSAEGYSDVTGGPVDVGVLRNIGLNVAGELIRYGWLPRRDHPDDPPPAPPALRR